MILLDTNIYIDAFTDPAFGAEFEAFHGRHLPRIVLSAVVVHELLVGATTPADRRRLLRGLVEPFRTRGRIHVPSMATWAGAADLDRRLRGLGGFRASLAQRSFGHDLLLAASARELGATLITRNQKDFAVISRSLPFKVAPPWPEL